MKQFAAKFFGLLVIAALVAGAWAAAPVQPVRAAGGNLLSNGDFASGLSPWWANGVTTDTSSGALVVTVPGSAANPWDAIVGQGGVSITSGSLYTVTFTASSSTPVNIKAILQLDSSPYTAYFNQTIALTSTPTLYSYTFSASATDAAAAFQFQLGGLGAFDFTVDDVSIVNTTQRISNGDFTSGSSPWWSNGVTSDASSGAWVISVPGTAANPWEAIVGQGGISLTSGTEYTVSFDASASAPGSVKVLAQLDAAPYTAYLNETIALTTTPQHFSFVFTQPSDDPAAAFQFQLGNGSSFDFTVDNVSLTTEAVVAPPSSVPSHIGELLKNGSFNDGLTAPWFINGGTALVNQSRMEVTITNGEANPWDVIVGQTGVPVYQDGDYTFTVKAWASAAMTVNAIIQLDGAPYTQYYNQALALTTKPKTFTFTFSPSADDPAAVFQFQMGGQGNNVVYFDNISLNGPEPVSHMTSGDSLLNNTDFASGASPWNVYGGSPDTSSGELAVTISNGGVNPWDSGVGQNGVAMLEDGDYVLDFDAYASEAKTINLVIQLNNPPYTSYFSTPVALTDTLQHFHFEFTSAYTNPASAFQFHIGGQGAYTFYLDNITLLGPKPTPPTSFVNIVRLNQVGYLPNAPKVASVATDITDPLDWTLYDSGNNPVASGLTTLFGSDEDSGENIHLADFSSFTTPGSDYTLEVYGEISHPFDIGQDVYQNLQYDALAYFYHNRAGIAIEMPYASDSKWERAAAHLNTAPNLGDNNVGCFDQTDTAANTWTGCNYTLDVPTGWYDAGDHGKYVVNGGIAAWTMLNQYERAQYLGGNAAAFADGEMNIPENANGVADLLDEARWEVEFLLDMQVPTGGTVEGVDRSGMVHHKLHDQNWTGLGLDPADDSQPRYLYPPSTAATLNMAAVAAQCARIWQDIDATFADRCLDAAETAWDAAVATPDLYAVETFTGGGAYGDTNVTDEFYWAASELFISTGAQEYKDFITSSTYYQDILSGSANGDVLTGSSMYWGQTETLGNLSLAVVPNNLPIADIQGIWANIVTVADGYSAAIETQGYGLPFKPQSAYEWGSNSNVLNNMIIIGLAHDLTKQDKYLDAISAGMDYLLGRNPVGQSYVAGYGEKALENPHHRFWAPSISASFPEPFPGAVAGGPNEGMQDPFIQAVFPAGCADAPMKCYVDHLESYSTNEVAVNWNAPLAWVAAFIDDTSPKSPVITSPANNSSTNDTTPTISGTAEAGSTVKVYVNNALNGDTLADGSGDWSYTPSSGLADGTYILKATATLGETSSYSSPVVITIDTAAPAAPVITSPANNTGSLDATPTISGTAEANSAIQVYVDNALNGTTTADGSGSWSYTPTTGLTVGTHSVKATAADAQNNTSADSNVISIKIRKQVVFRSAAAQDGWVLESTATSNVGGTFNANSTTLRLGDDTLKRQYKSIVSFATASLPDGAVIISAQLKIKQAQTPFFGTNPFGLFGSLFADIRNGAFGASSLAASDFQAAASVTKTASFTAPVSQWYSAVINAAGRAQVNKTGQTQFRIYFNMGNNANNIADYLRIFSGESALPNRPQLIIVYELP